MHCYHFENLGTTMREYKALKGAEFLKMAPILFKPSLSVKYKDEMLSEYEKQLRDANCLPIRVGANSGNSKPLQLAKNIAPCLDAPAKMNMYIQTNKKLFNPSQLMVLDMITKMPDHDILLIQGPPGTGKTHTITGILSMLLSTDEVKRIMVCAPSNAAIDEIIHRISLRGFVGQPEDSNNTSSILHQNFSVDGLILRIGAMEYEPSPEVKRHTLDERLSETLNGNKQADLK
jgi:hypothetical protein